MKTKLTKILTLLLILAVISVFAAGCNAEPKPVEGEKNIACELVVSSGLATMTVKREGKPDVVYACETFGGTLEDIFNDLATETDFTYTCKRFKNPDGAYLTKICGISADYNKDQTWFTIYIGGEMSVVGMSELDIQDGIIYKVILSR